MEVHRATMFIHGHGPFTKAVEIAKGLSGDKKYRVTDSTGVHMLLRISDIARRDRKAAEYAMMERVYAMEPLTAMPLGFGVCDGGASCYSIAQWLDGEDAEAVIPSMNADDQYALGVKTGELLRRIHALPAPAGAEGWNMRFGEKVRRWLDAYDAKPEIHSPLGRAVRRCLTERAGVLDARPQTFVHGDFNPENIIVTPEGNVKVIDFNCYNGGYGDPWCDLDNMAWMPTTYAHFQTGQVHGYFDGAPPAGFWDVLSYYLAYDALAALTDPYELNGIEDGTEIAKKVWTWTEGFVVSEPTWYMGDL